MKFNTSEFDLESIDDVTLNNIVKDIESIDLTIGYSRADLESIENRLEGAFTDIEEFDFREIPTGVSKVNLNIIRNRLNELRNIVGQGINTRYNTYVSIYGSLTHELYCILDLISNFSVETPTPLLDSLDSVYLYDTEYDSVKLVDAVFSKYPKLYTKVRLLRDSSKNDRINSFNYIIENMIDCDNNLDYKKEYSYSILKKVLNTNEITYNNTISLFSNSNDLKDFINTITSDLLSTLADLKDILQYDYGDDKYHTRWFNSASRLDKYISIANDKDSLKLLKLLSLFRYFDNYKN